MNEIQAIELATMLRALMIAADYTTDDKGKFIIVVRGFIPATDNAGDEIPFAILLRDFKKQAGLDIETLLKYQGMVNFAEDMRGQPSGEDL